MTTDLETRLRRELSHSGSARPTGTAPPIAQLTGVVDRRRRRNRLVLSLGAFVVVAGLIAGGAASLLDDTSDVLAVGDDTGDVDLADTETDTQLSPETEAEAESEPLVAGVESEPSVGEQDEPGDVVDESTELATTPDDETIGQVANLDDARVESRSSAVDFFGSSGVFIVPSPNGLGGLATRFDDTGTETIGLVSANGLDWEEVVVTGIPDGAAPVSLQTYQGVHVAHFERNALGERSAWVGTSSDLVNWELAEPLEGEFVVAQRVLVGPNGVVVLGDSEEPDVWSGPIGGPYEVREQVPADAIATAAVVDGEFVVMGFDAATSQQVLLRSSDGDDWVSEAFVNPSEALGFGDLDRSVWNQAATLLVSGPDDNVSYVSTDLGGTWLEINHGPGLSDLAFTSEVLAADGAAGLLGGADGTTLVLANGESVSVVELPDSGDVRRTNLVHVQSDRAVVLVETESGLTWVVVSR